MCYRDIDIPKTDQTFFSSKQPVTQPPLLPLFYFLFGLRGKCGGIMFKEFSVTGSQVYKEKSICEPSRSQERV